MEIQTHKRTRKASFAENKVILTENVALEPSMCSLQQSGRDERRKVTVGGRITAKVNVCGVAKRFPQNGVDKGGL